MTSTIKLNLISYCYDTREPDQKAEWEALKAELKKRGLECFKAFGDPNETLHSGIYTMQGDDLFENLFDNQMNATDEKGKGVRIFDWRVYAKTHNTHIKDGYYVEAGPGYDELVKLRKNTVKCGYCGHKSEKQSKPQWCTSCLGSEYLKETNLPMLRMRPISTVRAEAKGVPTTEFVELYRTKQRERVTDKIRKRRNDTLDELRKKTELAHLEFKVMSALVEHVKRPDLVRSSWMHDHAGRACLRLDVEGRAEIEELREALEGFDKYGHVEIVVRERFSAPGHVREIIRAAQ